MATEHQFVQLRHRLCILSNLLLRRRVENGQARIHVPLVRIDAEGDVDLHVLDTTNVSSDLPWELIVGLPSCAHAEEGSVCNRLRVRCDAVMRFSSEIDVLGSETREDALNKLEALGGGPMLDENLQITLVFILPCSP